MKKEVMYNRAFTQPAFWDFVATLRNRDAARGYPADEQPAAEASRSLGNNNNNPRRGARMGPGRGGRNRKGPRANPNGPITMFDADAEQEHETPPPYPMRPQETGIIPAPAAASDDEKTLSEATPLMVDEQTGDLADFPKLRQRLQGKGFSDEQIEARIEKRRAHRAARQNGEGVKAPGPRGLLFRKRLQEKGFSEEEINQRIEQRRARRAARMNGEGNAPRPRHFRPGRDADEANQAALNAENAQGCKRGFGYGNRRGGQRFRQGRNQANANTATNVPSNSEGVTSDPEKSASTGQGSSSLANAEFPQFRHISEITKGGPAKFAGRFNKNNNNQDDANRNDGGSDEAPREIPNADAPPNRYPLRSGMQNLALNDDDDAGDASIAGMRQRQLNKMNKKKNKENKKQGKKLNKSGFAPRADIFATDGSYFVQLPVPGAKLEDVAVSWDAEESAVLVAGAVHRPALSEFGRDATLVQGKRAVGTFQRSIKLSKKKGESVKVYENGITATVQDGVLTVEVPKYDGDAGDVSNEEGFVEVNEKV